MFNQQSQEYILQIEAEIERLQQLRDQVQMTIQGDNTIGQAEAQAPRKRAAKKTIAKKVTAKKSIDVKAPAKRGRPKSNPTTEG